MTLTFNDSYVTPSDCAPWVRRVAQVTTDTNGGFAFDFILSGIPYVISTTDTSGLSAEEIQLILESTVAGEFRGERYLSLLKDGSVFDSASEMRGSVVAAAEGVDRAVFNDAVDLNSARSGTAIPVVLTFRGRATVLGRVLAADGVTPVAEAAVNLFPDQGSRELARGMFSGDDGSFRFEGVPLGVFSLVAESPDAVSGKIRTQVLSGRLRTPGEALEMNFRLPSLAERFVELVGVVQEPDGRTHGNATVYATDDKAGVLYAQTVADADGSWRMRVFHPWWAACQASSPMPWMTSGSTRMS